MRNIRSVIILSALLLLTASFPSAAQRRAVEPRAAGSSFVEKKSGDAYLFSYFTGNGEDGLHLAYSSDGVIWHPLNNGHSLLKPTVGRDKLMRDPNITVGRDGVFQMVWTSSWTDPVIGHATSQDLIHWSEQQAISPMANEPTARNVWAPETFYDARAKQYLLFWSTTIPGRFPQTEASGDKGLNHRIYLMTTKDFQTFTPTRLFYDPGFEVIDATIIKDGSRYVMFFKDETRQPVAHKNIHYAVSKRAEGPFGAASGAITGQYWAEGPTAIKIGKRWIVYFDRYRDHRYGAVASADLKQWEDISAQVQFPSNARHGTVLRVSQKVLSRLLELK
jgi:hypothetical protein